ncbi:WXG100 family type VII secretion target, partial [Saccharomonospora iraqiensis]|uniref:WXG100 family type VII secretion target n=1 Tax=Saccharomonospora iraqiensis TaxID=52698 RepID=UPI00022E18D0
MSETDNPLVAEAPENGDGPGPLTSGNGDYGWAGGIGIAESAMDTYNGIQDGNWVEGGLGAIGLVAEGASAAIDPFGWLMSSVASFLMEHVEPLKEMLDSVCGDPPVIQSYSETWSNVAGRLDETRNTFANAVKNGTAGWTGDAADAYRASCAEQEETLAGASTVAGAISTVVMIMGEVVTFVRETVRDLIADLVGKLISWVLETVCSLGFGTPVVVAQAVAAISKWATRIAELLQKLVGTIRKVSPLLGELAEVFGSIIRVCGKIAGKVTGLDVISTGNITPGGFFQRGGPDTPDLGGSAPGGGGAPGGGSAPVVAAPRWWWR